MAITGPEVLAGILAIALRSIGFIGKLAYKSIEETSYEPVEAITATVRITELRLLATSAAKLRRHQYLLQDINICKTTVLGLVSASGIGLNLNASVDLLRRDRVGMIFVLIFVLVLISETISAQVRKAII